MQLSPVDTPCSQGTRSSSRVLVLSIDGLGDLTIPALGDRTPLEGSDRSMFAWEESGVRSLCDPKAPLLTLAHEDTMYLYTVATKVFDLNYPTVCPIAVAHVPFLDAIAGLK